jgi:hypothetical protein
MSVLDRLGVLEDTLSLARGMLALPPRLSCRSQHWSLAGYTPVEQALDFVGAFRNDKEYTIWMNIITTFTSGWSVLFRVRLP